MNPIIGLWNTYNRGEVYSTLDRLISYLVRRGVKIKSTFNEARSPIKSTEELFDQLKDFEKKQGTRKLLDVLIAGLELTCEDSKKIRTKINILLRAPERSTEDLKVFRSMVANWVENSDLTFMERFFKSSQALFLHTPLERGLKRKFGYVFQYKVLIVQ